jgi:hypothetical protein
MNLGRFKLCFKIMFKFASALFTMGGKTHGCGHSQNAMYDVQSQRVKTIPKCEARLKYCLFLGPLLWESPSPWTLPYTTL